jgi:transcriptional regulator with XRE-family HTH domain
MSEQSNNPFAELGAKLRRLRERKHESLEDASGAAEIDPPTLKSYEEGVERPEEDILHVLLHHFDANEEQADELWSLAGYRGFDASKQSSDEASFQPTPAMFVLPIDGRILYSDSVHVAVNKQGVVLNFMQNVGPDGKILPVSRIGMSKEHANAMIQLLSDCLQHSDPKQLPNKKDSDKQG